MVLVTIFNIVFGAALSGLGWLYAQIIKKQDQLEKDLVQVKLAYASKDEIKEIKELIERGFDKLEARLDKKVDK